jgi:hypothetical protein
MVDMNTRSLIDNSARVVVATVVSVETQPVQKYNNTLFTFITFHTDEIVTGDIDDTFTLRLFGGTDGATIISSPLDFNYQPGEQLVMFLGEDNSDGHPLIFPQGIYRVKPHPMSDAPMIGRGDNSAPHGGIVFYRAGTNDAYGHLPQLIPLSDYVASVKRAQFSTDVPAPALPLAPANNQ